MLKFIIAFTQYAYQKFLALSPKERRHFLDVLKRPRGKNFCALQGQPHGTYRIRFNIHERIIARWQPPYLVVTDFVSHTEMEQTRFSTALGHDESLIIDIDIDDEALNDSVLQPEQLDPKITPMVSQWERYLEPLEPAELYFAVYDENLHDYRISADILISHTQQQLVNTTLDGAIHIALEGGAGSGKTSVAVLHALYRSPYEVSRYITYSQYLVDYSQSIVSQMMTPNQPTDSESDSSQATLNFTIQSFHTLCQELVAQLGLDGEHFHPSRHMTLVRYLRDAQSGHEKRQRARQWHEQQFIKGTLGALATTDHRLPFETYCQMRSKDLDENLAADIYRRQVPWDGWDDLDITHALLDALRQQPEVESLWDTLYCDEVQDFTEIQLYLLFRLTKNNITEPPSFFVTGDPDQILNPSGFAWKRINNALYQLHQDYAATNRAFGHWPRVTLPDDQRHLKPDQRVPPLIFTDNFRSRAPIVTLGNRIRKLAQPQSVIELKAFRSGESKPLLVTAALTDMLANRNIFGARDALIVADDSTLDQLIDQFSQGGIRTERVLLMTEVKGLEFDGVMVLGFFGWFEGWQNRNAVVGLSEYMVNLLYVCATRARERLIFVEETECRYWNDPLFDDCLERGDVHHPAVANFFNPPRTQEEWFESAQEFEQAGNYRQARENYERGEFYRDAQRMAAYIAASEADFEVAAAAWRELLSSSPTPTDQAHDRDQLIAALKQVHPTLSSQAELAELYEARGRAIDLQEAARLHQELKNFDKAALLWECSDLEAAAICYEQAGSLLDAARCWAGWGDCAQAANCAQKAGDHQGAAEYWQQAGKPLQAATVLREGKYFNEAIAIYEDQQRYATIAEIYEHDLTLPERAQIYWQRAAEQAYRQNLRDQALRYWRQIQNLAALAEDYSRNEETTYYAAECWELVSAWSAAAEIWARQSETLHRAAQAYERAEQWEQAAHCWEQTNDESVTDRDRWQQAERCWLKAECPTEAARVCSLAGWYAKAAGHYEQAVQWSEAAAVWLTLGQFQQADRCYRQQKPVDHRAIAQLWEAEGSEAGIELAIASWEVLGNDSRIIELLLDLERWHAAADRFAMTAPAQAARIYAAIYGRDRDQAAFDAALAIWRADPATYWRDLVALYQAAHNWDAALVLLETYDLVQAARLYEDLGYLDAASRCWQRLEKWDQAAEVWFETDLARAAQVYSGQSAWLKAAAVSRQAENLAVAASLYIQAEAWALAAQCQEELAEWSLAIANWQKLNRWDRIAAIYMQLGQLEAAAKAWVQLPDGWIQAVRCWLELNRFSDAGRVCEAVGEPRRAAECYSRDISQPESQRRAAQLWWELNEAVLAAACYEQAGDYAQAAPLFENAGDYERAMGAWAASDRPDRERHIARILAERQHNYLAAARIHHDLREWQAATDLYCRAYYEQEAKSDYLHLAIANLAHLQDWNRIAAIYSKDLKQPLEGATWLAERQHYALAAIMLQQVGELHQAAALWLKAVDRPREECFRQAAHCYRDNADWHDAANCYEAAGDWARAGDCWLEHWRASSADTRLRAAECYGNAERYREAAQLCEDLEEWGQALRFWEQDRNWQRVGELQEQLGQYREAAQAWQRVAGAKERAAQLFERSFAESHDLSDLQDAVLLWNQLGQRRRAAPLHEQLAALVTDAQEATSQYQAAAQAWQDCRELELAIANWQAISAWLEIAQLYEALEDYAAALDFYQICIEPKPWQAIQRCASRLTPPDWYTIGVASEQLHEPINAAHAYSQLANAVFQRKAAQLYAEGGQYDKSALIWEQLAEWDVAKATWKQAGQWRKAIRICLEELNTTDSRLEAASIYENDFYPKKYAEAASLYFQLELYLDAERCWSRSREHWSVLAEKAEYAQRWHESAFLWQKACEWEKAATQYQKANRLCEAIIALETALEQTLEPLSPKPIPLVRPEAPGPGFWSQLWGMIVDYEGKEADYWERQREITEWHAREQKRQADHQKRISQAIATVRQQCGCSGACPVAKS